jgi:hypothetical protein
MLRATNHAGVTVCNRDRESGFPNSWQNAFLFLATHGPIFIASSSSATLIQWRRRLPGPQCGFQYRRWNCSPIPALVVKTIVHSTTSIPRSGCWHRSLCLLVFVSSAALVPQAAFGLRKDSAESPHAPAPEWLTAVGFSMLTSKASLLSQGGLPQTCPSVCLLLPSAEMPTKLLSLLSWRISART